MKQEKKKLEIVKSHKTILLVDDEDLIIDVGVQLLKNIGYNTLYAQDGIQALDVYKKNKEKIVLVILDMIMPKMSGAEIFDKIKQINPDVKILLSSGYSINAEAKQLLQKGCDDFIQKPFSLAELSHKINKIIG